MNSATIRRLFIDFFVENGHKHYEHSALAPKDYDTTMFTIAGMKQFNDYFLGKPIEDKKIVTCQPCLRTNDLDNVGKTTRHHSFFEMLGNFSFGAYFKEEAINLAFKFLTKILGIPIKNLYFTVYYKDLESFNIWNQKAPGRVIYIETDDNFWSSGEFGPCGPCTEIYFDTENEIPVSLEIIKQSILAGEGRFLEIWNIVFMEFNKKKDGIFNLETKCVDTGMGLERIASVMNKSFDNYSTSSISPIVEYAKQFNLDNFSSRFIADHMKTIVFLLGEGLNPSNEGQGYILRFMIRRCLIYEKNLEKYVDITMNCLEDEFCDYRKNFIAKEKIINTLKSEEQAFSKTLKNALGKMDKCQKIDEEFVFKLYETYGLPFEISKKILEDRKIKLDWNKVHEFKIQHSQVSKKKIAISFGISTEQVDYDISEINAKVLFLNTIDSNGFPLEELQEISSGKFILATNRSCFYGKSGGQEGDHGTLEGNQFKNKFKNKFKAIVFDTWKQKISSESYILLHFCELTEGKIALGDEIFMKIDKNLRQARARAHSATHLITDYLMKNYNINIESTFVDSDYCRIDINTENLKNENLKNENLKELINKMLEHLNEITKQDIQSIITYENFDEITDVLEKDKFNYSSIVRVVNFPEVSKQLCGGTHVKTTKDIGNIIFLKDSAKTSSIRRLQFNINNDINNPKSSQL